MLDTILLGSGYRFRTGCHRRQSGQKATEREGLKGNKRMEQYLYDIFQTSGKNGCADLTIALAMFLSDARAGRQQYGPDGLDYKALHRDYPAL